MSKSRQMVFLLGERLDPVTVGFALAVIGVVFVSRRLSVGQAQQR